MKLFNCIDFMVEFIVFLILKDYKLDFENYIKCCFINLVKSDVGKISKFILDIVNLKICE